MNPGIFLWCMMLSWPVAAPTLNHETVDLDWLEDSLIAMQPPTTQDLVKLFSALGE